MASISTRSRTRSATSAPSSIMLLNAPEARAMATTPVRAISMIPYLGTVAYDFRNAYLACLPCLIENWGQAADKTRNSRSAELDEALNLIGV